MVESGIINLTSEEYSCKECGAIIKEWDKDKHEDWHYWLSTILPKFK